MQAHTPLAVAQKRALFDPRTKLVLLLMVSTIVITGGGGEVMQWLKLALMMLPVLLFTLEGKLKRAFMYLAVLIAFVVIGSTVLPLVSGAPNLILSMCYVIISRFLPCVMMSWYFLSTTSVSEFVCAMERMHMPQFIIIPLSVIFRFVPTVTEEFGAIGDAMKMRGVRFGGGKVGAMVEYRVIPMMMCSLKIGEELSASALTRGLGSPIKRTNICEIGFKLGDVVALLFSIAAMVVYILNKVGML